MRNQRFVTYLALFAAWLAFSYWQYRGYQRQCDLIRETLHQSSHAIMTAVLGGIQSHRRVGPFFDSQLEDLIDELAKAKVVVAVAIVAGDHRPILAAGAVPADRLIADFALGDTWAPDGFRLVQGFELPEFTGGPGSGGGRGPGFGGRWRDTSADTPSKFAAGQRYYAILLLDRSHADTLLQRTAWLHMFAAATALVVAVCLAILWNVMINLAEARGRARVYATEMRHLRELSQAAAGLAHETRNPLGLIRGWAQRLAEPEITDAQRQRITKTLIEECDRVTARINQFLTFARPRSPELQPVDLTPLADELAVILNPDLVEKQLTLLREISADTRWIEADPDLLRQALFNLIQNAIQFSPTGRPVRLVSTPARNGTTCIEVIDSGPGVQPDDVDSLFTPYFTTRAEGTGLGLAIVRHIVKLHGWQVGYRLNKQHETVFYLCGIHVAPPIHHSDR